MPVLTGKLGTSVNGPDGLPRFDGVAWDHVDWRCHEEQVRRLRGSRVALSIETGTRNAMGLNEYLVVYGTARVTEGGAAELLQHLAHTYLGPDVRFPPMDNPPAGYITHIRVDRVAGVGPWAAQR